eukprot:6545531-Prorocentrum_lima.AAC.1
MHRTASARKAVNRARRRFRDPSLSLKARLSLLQALIVSRLLYGSESWPLLCTSDLHLLYQPVIFALRLLCSAWSSLADPHLPDREVLRLSGFPSIESLIARRRLGLLAKLWKGPSLTWAATQSFLSGWHYAL